MRHRVKPGRLRWPNRGASKAWKCNIPASRIPRRDAGRNSRCICFPTLEQSPKDRRSSTACPDIRSGSDTPPSPAAKPCLQHSAALPNRFASGRNLLRRRPGAAGTAVWASREKSPPAPTSLNEIMIHASDHFELDLFWTNRLAFADVGAATELLGVELPDHP